MSGLEVMSKEEKKETKTKKEKKTKVFIEEYKGNLTFSVFEVDDEGKKVKEWPEVGVGMRKASLLIKHHQELQNWVDGVQGTNG